MPTSNQNVVTQIATCLIACIVAANPSFAQVQSYTFGGTTNTSTWTVQPGSGATAQFGPGLNTPPVANAGADYGRDHGPLGFMMGFTGSGFDADGDQLTYSWSQVAGSVPVEIDSGQNAQEVRFIATGIEPDRIVFQLIVNDGKVDSPPDTVTVTVGDWDGDGFLPQRDGDCDNENPAVHPGALDKTIDGIDQDCDGDDAQVNFVNSPGGNMGGGGSPNIVAPLGGADDDNDGVSVAQGDCDDADPMVRPGLVDDAMDGIDQDCDGIDGPVAQGLTLQPGARANSIIRFTPK